MRACVRACVRACACVHVHVRARVCVCMCMCCACGCCVRTTCPWQAFIHGGGFMGGNGAQHVLRGSHLAASRCIVVANFNYRLGPLGFFPAHVDAGQSGGMNGLLAPQSHWHTILHLKY